MPASVAPPSRPRAHPSPRWVVLSLSRARAARSRSSKIGSRSSSHCQREEWSP
jgi:hypothetical protein